mgnify:CR=1 FL=1
MKSIKTILEGVYEDLHPKDCIQLIKETSSEENKWLEQLFS